jgi:tetratricopeptide (TPR) repeat protein
MMLRANEVEQGITALENLIKNDPRNNYYLLALAQALEYKVRNFDAIKVREQITVFDPNNVKNYLQLGRLYKLSGDTAKANQMRLKILSFAPNTAQAQAAIAELSF